MVKFLSKISESKKTCIFISPHLDDAILSAGGFISILSKKTKVIVINVFTQALDDKPTLSARRYLHLMGYQKASILYKKRRNEDKKALDSLRVTTINLNFIEALWRKKTGIIANMFGQIIPEFAASYPFYQLHIASGNIAKADTKTIQAIRNRILEVVKNEDNPFIFSPLGIGKHVDHCIVKHICDDVFPTNIIYWSDFPYNIRENYFGNAHRGYKKAEFLFDTRKKAELIRYYTSQIRDLFENDSIPKHNEVFFIKET